MTMNATVSWDLPTTRESGNALPVEDILHVILSLSADQGGNFTVMDTIAPPATSHLLPDLTDGTWIVRLMVVDTDNKRSSIVDTPFVVDSSPPGPVENPNIALAP